MLVSDDYGYAAALHRLDDDLVLRGLSQNTRASYLTHVRLFFAFCQRPVDQLTTEDIRRFLTFLITERRVAPATANVYSAAIRFLFAVTLNRPLNYLQIPRAKPRRALPNILSRPPLSAIFDHCATVKHRAVLTLIYGSGLRVSEAASLRVGDIDSPAMRVFVSAGKGNQDRYTILSATALRNLRDRPPSLAGWLFPGTGAGGHLTAAAITLAFERAVDAAGVLIPVSIHTLRHCFATHLLEDGATLLQIKELLGHASLHSTTVYLPLANLTGGVRSPLDGLPVSEGPAPA